MQWENLLICSFNRYIIYHSGYKTNDPKGYGKKKYTSLSPVERHSNPDTSVQLIGFPTSLGKHLHTYTRKDPYKYKESGNSSVCPGSRCTSRVTCTTGKCYECSQCGKAISSSRSLQRHLKIPMGKGCYKHEPCTKGFNHHTYLQTRKRTHNGEVPYDCKQYDKTFRLHPTLQLQKKNSFENKTL